VLTVNNDGSACGHFDSTPALFMPTRAQPPTDSVALLKTALRDVTEAATGRSHLDLNILNDQKFLFFAALLIPDVSSMGFTPTDGEPQELLLARDGSWAYCIASGIIYQAGNRNLWNELETIANQWKQLDQPARHRFGFIITTNTTHQLWLDNPTTHHTWTLGQKPTLEQFGKHTVTG
jgi:hypothetical protein